MWYVVTDTSLPDRLQRSRALTSMLWRREASSCGLKGGWGSSPSPQMRLIARQVWARRGGSGFFGLLGHGLTSAARLMSTASASKRLAGHASEQPMYPLNGLP